MGVISKYRPHVFVVMPFGRREVQAASGGVPAVEVDFDQVYQRLLAPALRRAGCEPFRADEEKGAGDIRTDVFFELVTADFVLADISLLNPNVFYELGVRQGVAERGVILVHGGHSRRPFDIAPDRTFGYDGALFVHPVSEVRAQALADAVNALELVIRGVLESDAVSKSSPVYKELAGLEPPDVRRIANARARWFGAAFEEIGKRIEVARKRGLVGDILTLADEAPNRLYRARLLGIAGKSLIDLEHFELALELLNDAIELDGADIDSRSFVGLALNRVGRVAQAEVVIQALVEQVRDHSDGAGALGRVYKDQWRSRWESLASAEERRAAAATYAAIAERSIDAYASALRRDPRSHYNGINALALAKVLEHVGHVTEHPLADWSALVEIVSKQTLELTRGALGDAAVAEHLWALATRGELALLNGDAVGARKLYGRASTMPGVTLFQLESMLRQIELYEGLGFQPEASEAARRGIEAGRSALPKAAVQPRKVIVASGHMIDTPERAKPRFPPAQEGPVAARIAETLARWNVGPADVLITGAARGADLLVAEACLARGCPVILHVAREEGEYLVDSVDLPSSRWRERYFAVKANPLTRTRFQPDELGTPPASVSVHERNNRWCLNSAWAAARKREHVLVLLVWDGQPTGDGPGGTSHAAKLAKEYAGELEIIQPTPLDSDSA